MRVACVEPWAMRPPARSSTMLSRPIVHSPARAQWLTRRRSGSA
jgi:hypothetical protein